MTKVGLVLGAGGIVGQAYHAGVLASLEHDFGWDPRTADTIVGTSAGSITGTLLRFGVPASELAAWAVDAPLSLDRGTARDLLDRERPEFPPLELWQWLRGWRLPPVRLLRRLARRPWALRPSVIATTMMPAGPVDLSEHAEFLHDTAGRQWPDGLRVCVVRRDDGKRVVFGTPGARPPIGDAVAASCAIPGYFSPVRINGHEYFDGGIHSPSNADVLAGAGLDLVIVVSPMSAAGGLSPVVDAPYRYSIHRRLERELRQVVRSGTEVVRFEPARTCLAAMGINMMAEDRSDRVVQAAFIETGRYAHRDRIGRRLALLPRQPAPQPLVRERFAR